MQRHFDRVAVQHGPTVAVKLFRKWIPHYVRRLLSNRQDMVRLLQIADPAEWAKAMEKLGAKQGE